MAFVGYAASILMGLSLGLIGGGGSILTVPILVYLFSLNPIISTTYSLFVVGLTALTGGVFYLKRGEVDLKTGVIFAIPSALGAYVTRAYVIPSLPDHLFSIGTTIISKALLIMVLFALLMVVASIKMIKAQQAKGDQRESSPIQRIRRIATKGLFVGCVTGFVGAGGGFLIIPALVLLVGLPMKIAVGTSLLIIAFNSLIAFFGSLHHQTFAVDWKLLITIASIAISGLFLGTTLSSKVPEKSLKKIFGYFVLIMGTIILFDQLRKL
ncbi:MAG: sulfite exporter TauE/SafE family protein [Pseudobdellovibrionaceae bacterium]